MSFRPKSAAAAATTAAVLMLLTAGCSGSAETTGTDSSKSAGGPNAGPAAEQKDAGPAAGQRDKVDNGAAAANIDPAHPPKPVASFTAPLPYDKDPKTTARFDIYSLKRQGKLVPLRFSVTPKFSTPESDSLWDLMDQQNFEPTLVDPVNLRAYAVVKAGGVNLSTPDNRGSTYSGQPLFLVAVFAAPPTNVDKVNLNLFNTLPTLMEVAVQ